MDCVHRFVLLWLDGQLQALWTCWFEWITNDHYFISFLEIGSVCYWNFTVFPCKSYLIFSLNPHLILFEIINQSLNQWFSITKTFFAVSSLMTDDSTRCKLLTTKYSIFGGKFLIVFTSISHLPTYKWWYLYPSALSYRNASKCLRFWN